MPLLEAGVRLFGIRRLLLDAGVVAKHRLVDGVPAPAFSLLVLAGSNGNHDAWPIPGAHDDVVHPDGAVDEVPLPQRPFLSLRDQQRLALHDEEVLLVGLPVIHRHRITRAEDEQIDADLRPILPRLEVAEDTAFPSVVPRRVAGVEHEPALSAGDAAMLRLFEGSFGNHPVHRLTDMQSSLPVAERPRRPDWLKVRAPSPDSRYYDVKKLIHGASLHTICEEARCPNIGECWGRGTATFQILGDTCTRACRYCYVHSGKPESPPDPLEPLRLANVAAQMELKHVVVTSVDRDDVPDRGAGHYAATIRALKAKVPQASIEVLTPDFLDVEEQALQTVLGARPDVFNHNIETVRRLHTRMRGAKASYDKALWLLQRAKEIGRASCRERV